MLERVDLCEVRREELLAVVGPRTVPRGPMRSSTSVLVCLAARTRVTWVGAVQEAAHLPPPHASGTPIAENGDMLQPACVYSHSHVAQRSAVTEPACVCRLQLPARVYVFSALAMYLTVPGHVHVCVCLVPSRPRVLVPRLATCVCVDGNRSLQIV